VQFCIALLAVNPAPKSVQVTSIPPEFVAQLPLPVVLVPPPPLELELPPHATPNKTLASPSIFSMYDLGYGPID
jgi:hypothetical protein